MAEVGAEARGEEEMGEGLRKGDAEGVPGPFIGGQRGKEPLRSRWPAAVAC